MKVLNIDAYVTPKRAITLKGVSYPVLPLNVQQFIDNLTVAEKLESEGVSGSDLRMSTQVKEGLVVLRQAIPSMPDDVVTTLSVEAITAILQFIRGDLDPGDQATAPAGGATSQSTEEGADAKKPT